MQSAYQRPDLLLTGVTTLATCLTCLEKQNVGIAEDPYLRIPFSKSVSSSIQIILDTEEVSRRCWKCKTDRISSVSSTFSHLPDILILHVGRSRWTGVHTKVGEKLTCDKTLSLSLGGDGPSVFFVFFFCVCVCVLCVCVVCVCVFLYVPMNVRRLWVGWVRSIHGKGSSGSRLISFKSGYWTVFESHCCLVVRFVWLFHRSLCVDQLVCMCLFVSCVSGQFSLFVNILI